MHLTIVYASTRIHIKNELTYKINYFSHVLKN